MAPGQTHLLNPASAPAGVPSFGDAPTPAFGIHVSLPVGSHKPYVKQEAAYTPGLPVGKHATFRARSVEAAAALRRSHQALALHLDAYLSARTALAAKMLAHPTVKVADLASEVARCHRALTGAYVSQYEETHRFNQESACQLAEALS